MKKYILTSLLLGIASLATTLPTEVSACTRLVYLGADSLVMTARTLDWQYEMPTNLYVFPRGIRQKGAETGNALSWTSRYGSLVAEAYDCGACDGINEKGLVANLLWLSESDYARKNDERPVLNIGLWAQYVLDNFATVHEAVEELSKELFCIDVPTLPTGDKATQHLSISDATGNSAILEYLDGRLVIHEGKQYQVMTNSPSYDKQLAIRDYWNYIGGNTMMPGCKRSADRFVRASFYVNSLKKIADPQKAVAAVMSVTRNVSVPYGIGSSDSPNIASTLWRVVADQTNKVYYFEDVLSMGVLHINLKELNFRQGAPIMKLDVVHNHYTGDATKSLQPTKFMNVFEQFKLLMQAAAAKK
jgi:penicillin V acylase-like amidase (Ntn superfamily)